MVTINVSDKTKERFKKIKLEESAKQGTSLSEDDIETMLLDKFENKKQ